MCQLAYETTGEEWILGGLRGGAQVITRFEAGEALLVTVFRCMGKEVVVEVKAESD